MTTLPPAPPQEEAADACCAACGSMFHRADQHMASLAFPRGNRQPGVSTAAMVPEFPPGYDPGEADRLIGRDPHAAK